MNTNNVFLIWGQEQFLIDLEISKIISFFKTEAGEEIEIIRLDADELSPQELLANLEFSPLFAIRRILILKKPHWVEKSGRNTSKTEVYLQIIKDYLDMDNSGQVVIITAGELDASSKVVKLLKQYAQIVNVKTWDSEKIGKWIKEEFAARGRKINPEAANLLTGSGQDMYYILNLIDKVCLMNPENDIDRNIIENELESKEDIKIFKLTDALLNKNAPAALQAFYQLRLQGEHPVFCLYMITRQFLAMGKVKSLLESGKTRVQIEKVTGLRDFVVRRMAGYANSFSWSELKRLFEILLDVDIRLKSTGQDENIIMEALILEICRTKK